MAVKVEDERDGYANGLEHTEKCTCPVGSQRSIQCRTGLETVSLKFGKMMDNRKLTRGKVAPKTERRTAFPASADAA